MRARKQKGPLRYLLRAPVYLYQMRLGWLLGHRFLLLTHVGRRTGLHRQTVLEVMQYRKEGPEAVVLSGFGRDADWLRNIETTGKSEIDIGLRHFVATHRILGEAEAVRVVRNFEDHNRFMLPIVRYVLSRLLGWKYRGSDEECRRVVAQLPVIAFRAKN